MTTCGLVSVPRSGKHWLLAGIFDTLNVYPDNYLRLIDSNIYRKMERETNYYNIQVSDNNFFSFHLPPRIQSLDRCVFLDRKDKVKQAISWSLMLRTKSSVIFSDNEKKILDALNPSTIPLTEINRCLMSLNDIRERLVDYIESVPHLMVYYEDMLCDYDRIVKDVIYFLFNIKINRVICQNCTVVSSSDINERLYIKYKSPRDKDC